MSPPRHEDGAAPSTLTTLSEADTPNSVAKGEVWFREEERWELTWPIWHMLPREERRSLAHTHGYKTIGEFEEYMILQRAVGDSSNLPYEHRLVYESSPSSKVGAEPDKNPAAAKQPNADDDDNSVDEEPEEDFENERILSSAELIKRGGKLLMLPDDMLHRVFDWLPVDTYAVIALVSPHWKFFTRTEAAYKRLCERLYLNQSKRRVLHVSRFNNSYRTN